MTPTKQELKYDQKAIFRLDDECDLKPQDLANPDNMGFATIVKLVWAGLLHKNPNLTFDQVMAKYDIIGDLENCIEVIDEAFARDFPNLEEDEAKN